MDNRILTADIVRAARRVSDLWRGDWKDAPKLFAEIGAAVRDLDAAIEAAPIIRERAA